MNGLAILHYASPPIVGGVELTIYHHARGLADLGFDVRVISGRGGQFDERIKTLIEPLFGSTDPEILAVKKELDQGIASKRFDTLVQTLEEKLSVALNGCIDCIVHNVPTLNKNLPLAAALKGYAASHDLNLLAWCHDLAWTNPQYIPELFNRTPWTLLRQPWPGVRYITVSETRRYELAELMAISPQSVGVVVPGVDPEEIYGWTLTTSALAQRVNLMAADGIVLLPARLTRRKNIGLALRVLAELRLQSGKDYRLIVTGPPGPHNPTNPGYLGELLDIRTELNLQDAAHFLYAFGDGDDPLVPDNATIANLYMLADALIFPSIQEGFGIPMLEAGFAGLPVFCSDIPPFRETGQNDVTYFDPVNDSPQDIAAWILHRLQDDHQYRFRVRSRQNYRWESIIREHMVPLLQKG